MPRRLKKKPVTRPRVDILCIRLDINVHSVVTAKIGWVDGKAVQSEYLINIHVSNRLNGTISLLYYIDFI